jgi:hypothetical protein
MRRRRLCVWQRPFLASRFSCSAVIAPCGSSICLRPCGRDVRQVHQHFLGAVHVEYLAAGTLHKTTARLAESIAGRLKPLASIPQRIFSRGPISLIAPCLKIGLGAFRQEHLPCTLEIGAGLLEGRGGARLMFAGMRARIEPAVPFPWVGIVQIADALGDRNAVSD